MGESGVVSDSRELALTGLQAGAALGEGLRSSPSPDPASRSDIGLFESSGRGFKYLKPIFLSKVVHLQTDIWR
jgi:hypothetical protein